MLRALGFDKSSVITVSSLTFEECHHQLLDGSDVGYSTESPSSCGPILLSDGLVLWEQTDEVAEPALVSVGRV